MKLVLLLIIIPLLSSCLDDPDCILSASNNVNITFKKVMLVNGVRKDTVILIDSIMVQGLNSLFYKNEKVSKVSLPMNPHVTEASYFLYTQKKKDTVQIIYQSENIIISPSCGGYTYYSLLKIKTTSFKNSFIVNSKLVVNNTNNIEIRL